MTESIALLELSNSPDWFSTYFGRQNWLIEEVTINGLRAFRGWPPTENDGGAYLITLHENLFAIYVNHTDNYHWHTRVVNKPGEFFILNFAEADYLNYKEGQDNAAVLSSRSVTLADVSLVDTYIASEATEAHFLRIIMGRSFAIDLAKQILGSRYKDVLFNETKNAVFVQYELDDKSNAVLSELEAISIKDAAFGLHLAGAVYRLMASFQEVMRLRNKVVVSKIDKEDIAAIGKSRQFMHQYLDEKFPGIEKLSAIALMSATKFKQLFTKVYGVSPQKYFIHKRMELARHLIIKHDYSIGRVVAELGYENPSSFTRQFKKHFGVMPKAFRAAAL